MNRTLLAVGVLAILVEAFLITTWIDARSMAAQQQETDKVGAGARVAALIFASVFPVALVLLTWLFRLDGFSTGSVTVAVVLEAALYAGWAKSPQQEGLWLFLATSGFMAVLVALTLWFYRLQRPK